MPAVQSLQSLVVIEQASTGLYEGSGGRELGHPFVSQIIVACQECLSDEVGALINDSPRRRLIFQVHGRSLGART